MSAPEPGDGSARDFGAGAVQEPAAQGHAPGTAGREHFDKSEDRSGKSGAPALELDGVSVDLGGRRIIDAVSLRAYPGRVHAVLGRNGAGKSTTYRAVLGLIPVAAGQIRVNGRERDRAALARIGSSVNGPALYGHLPVRDNLRVHQLLLGLPRAEIDRVLDLVGLSDAEKTRARDLSTGMKARLALAIALLGSPEILLLDEPQNGLDPQGIAQLRRFLSAYAAAGATVVVSSHQLGEMARIADDLTVIARGRVAFSGPAADFTAGGDLEGRFFEATGEAPRQEGGLK